MPQRLSRSVAGFSLVAALLLGAPAPTRAAGAAELWVAQRGNATAPGSSCAAPGYVGATQEAIQEAIDDAADNAVVHICPGTYAIGGSGIEISGIAVTMSGEAAKKTILDGGASVSADGTWVSGGVRLVTSDDDLTLQKLTLQHGAARGDGDGGYGGAILDTNANLTVIGCVFAANSARFGGGAIRQYPSGREITVVDSVFKYNHADGEEGGAMSLSSSALIVRSSFLGNSSGDGYSGGAVFSSSSLEIHSGSFERNHSERDGGAIYADDDVTLTSSTFADNTANGSGGAVYADAGVVARSSFIGNDADTGGALAVDDLEVVRSTFSNNSAYNDGGAILSYGEVAISGSSFAGNVGEYGGAIASYFGNAHIASSYFAKNVARSTGGAIETTLAEVESSTFVANIASSDGGAIHAYDASALDDTDGYVSVSSSKFSRNIAEYDGGAIWVDHDATVFSSVFSQNSASGDDSDGGAIYADGAVFATDSTFTGNYSVDYGGAIYSSEGTTVLTGASFMRNSSGGGGAITARDLNLLSSVFIRNSARTEDGGAVFVVSPTAESLRSSVTNVFRGNRVPSGGRDIYLGGCGEFAEAISHFRAVNFLSSSLPFDINTPPSC